MNKLKSLCLGVTVFSVSGLAACGLTSPDASPSGFLKFSVSWPGFRVQVIPTETEDIAIQVFNSQGAEEANTNISRAGGTPRATITLSTGPKTVRVQARDANGVVLAESEASTDIQAGRTTQLETELEPVVPEPSPEPSSPPATNGGGATPPDAPVVSTSPAPEASEDPTTDPSATPSAEPVPSPSPTATLPPRTNGGSGGGGGGGGSSTPSPTPTPGGVTLTLTAGTTDLPGMSYATTIDAVLVNSASEIDSISWSCTNAQSVACDSFNITKPDGAIWTAPEDAEEFDPATEVIFTLTATASLLDGTAVTETITVTAQRGSGNVDLSDGGADRGVYDGAFD